MASPSLFAPAQAAAQTAALPPPAQSPLEVAHRLVSGDTLVLANFADAAGRFAVNIVIAIGILTVTIWMARWLSGATRRGIRRLTERHVVDSTLTDFAASLVRYLIIVIGMIAVLSQLGVKTTSVIAVLGAASLAIGLALQGALTNVAAGVMILVLRPYHIGDRVELNGTVGKVTGLDLFFTRLRDLNNLDVYVPNGKAFGDTMVNYTSTPARRFEVKVGVDYDDDLDLALELMLGCAKADPRVVADPPPWAKVTELGDWSVILTLRCWAPQATYTDAQSDILKAVKETFDANGLTFPYPHQVSVETREFVPPHSRRGAPPPAAAEREAPDPRAQSDALSDV